MRSMRPLIASLAASRNETSVFAGLDLPLYRAEDSAGDCRLAVHHSPVPNQPMKVCPSGAIENTKSPEPLGSRGRRRCHGQEQCGDSFSADPCPRARRRALCFVAWGTPAEFRDHARQPHLSVD